MNHDPLLLEIEEMLKSFRLAVPNASEDFFLARIYHQLSLARDLLRTASTKELIHLSDAHSGSELVLEEAFSGNGGAIFRATHFLDDSRFMYNAVVESWKRRLIDLLAQGRVLKVLRLAILSPGARGEDEYSDRLIRDHELIPDHEIRFLERDEFYSKASSLSFAMPHDIGIYGNRYLFIAGSTEPASLAGTWVRSMSVVEEATRFFDLCWQAATPKR